MFWKYEADAGPRSLSLFHLLRLEKTRKFRLKVFCFEPGLRCALGVHVELGHLPEWFVSFHVVWWDIHIGRWGMPASLEGA